MASRNFGARVNNWKNDFRRGIKDLRDDVEAAILGLEGEQVLFRARNIVNGNISDLTAYTVAAAPSRNDNVLNAAGDFVLLVGQSTAAQNGLYLVGTVGSGTAPLTRASKMAAASTLSQAAVLIAEGGLYANTRWTSTAVAPVIATTDPQFLPIQEMKRIRVRNVVNGNVASLAAYTVASNSAVNDAVLNVEGDVVLLVGQSTPAQNGVYVVGAVSVGAAALTRDLRMQSGLTLKPTDVEVVSGTVYANTKWFSTAISPVIGTTDPAFYPESVTQSVALSTGASTITNVPLLSTATSQIALTRQAVGGTVTSTIMYAVNSTPTAGKLGTASIAIFATVAAGTVNTADTSTIKVTVSNR